MPLPGTSPGCIASAIPGVRPVASGAPAPDADALAYASRAGVTDPTAIGQLSALVTGLKALGKWTSLYELWPLVATQNAGSGTTAHGLKGTLNFGVLGTAPTWDASGITLAVAAGNYLENAGAFTKTFSAIYAGSLHRFTSTSPGSSRSLQFLGGGAAGGFWAPFSNGQLYWDCLHSSNRINAACAVVANQMHLFAGSSSGLRSWRDGTEIASGSAPNLAYACNSLFFGHTGVTASFNGTVAAVFIFEDAFSPSDHAAFYQLLKDTIGSGLSLL